MEKYPRLTSKILSTNTFLRLEVSRGKYSIIKYRNFFASLNKLNKWPKNRVCTNNGRLVIYEGNNAIIMIRPWTLFGFGLPFLVFKGIIDRHFSIIRLVAAKIAEHFLMSDEIFLWTLKSVCRFLHSLIEKKSCFVHKKVFVDQIKQSDWSMVSSNEHMNHGCVQPELDRSKISKQAYSRGSR